MMEETIAEEITSEDVRQAFHDFSPEIRTKLLSLRKLILETAASMDGVGPIEETLKWGQPAYLTSKSKSGSTIRLGQQKSKEDQYAIYFICNTNLVERFRLMFPNELQFEGNRAIVFDLNDPVSTKPLRECITAALTYHHGG